MTKEPEPKRAVYIYGLTDPRTGYVGYVGRSSNPHARYISHCHEPGGKEVSVCPEQTSLKHQWMTSLRSAGVEPQLVLLECVHPDDARRAELDWIERFRQVNQANGNGHDRPKLPRGPRTTADGTSIAEVAASLGLTRQRVHQLLRSMRIKTRRRIVGGYSVVVLTPSQVEKLRNRPIRTRGKDKRKRKA